MKPQTLRKKINELKVEATGNIGVLLKGRRLSIASNVTIQLEDNDGNVWRPIEIGINPPLYMVVVPLIDPEDQAVPDMEGAEEWEVGDIHAKLDAEQHVALFEYVSENIDNWGEVENDEQEVE